MSKKSDKKQNQLNPTDVYVGMKIEKHSGKPFKFGGKVGTVAEVTVSEYTGEVAVRIAEDGSVVNLMQIKQATQNKLRFE